MFYFSVTSVVIIGIRSNKRIIVVNTPQHPVQEAALRSVSKLGTHLSSIIRVMPHFVSSELADLPLVRLDFSCNKVTSIPVCYRRLTQLHTIILDNNPLQSPPAQVCWWTVTSQPRVFLFRFSYGLLTFLPVFHRYVSKEKSTYLSIWTLRRVNPPLTYQTTKDGLCPSPRGVDSFQHNLTCCRCRCVWTYVVSPLSLFFQCWWAVPRTSLRGAGLRF